MLRNDGVNLSIAQWGRKITMLRRQARNSTLSGSDTSDTENSDKELSSSNPCNNSYKVQHEVKHCNRLSYWLCTGMAER